MKHYQIESVHTVHEDNYNDGEIAYKNQWEQKRNCAGRTLEEAVKEYYKHELHMDFDPTILEDTDDDTILDSRQINKNGYIPTREEKDLWINGEINLYSETIEIRIYELVRVTF